jgi:hypothetical protein
LYDIHFVRSVLNEEEAMARFVLNLDIVEGQPLRVSQQVSRGDELRITAGGRELRYRDLDTFELGELAGQEGVEALVRKGHLGEVNG